MKAHLICRSCGKSEEMTVENQSYSKQVLVCESCKEKTYFRVVNGGNIRYTTNEGE